MAKIQIDERLFQDLCKCHLFGSADEDTEARIRRGLQAKLDSDLRRRLYTISKTGATPEEREWARQAYLAERGIPEDYRWPEEQSPHE